VNLFRTLFYFLFFFLFVMSLFRENTAGERPLRLDRYGVAEAFIAPGGAVLPVSWTDEAGAIGPVSVVGMPSPGPYNFRAKKFVGAGTTVVSATATDITVESHSTDVTLQDASAAVGTVSLVATSSPNNYNLRVKKFVGAGTTTLSQNANDITFTSASTDVALNSAGGTSIVSAATGPVLGVLGLVTSSLLALVVTATTFTFDNLCIRIRDGAGASPPTANAASATGNGALAVGADAASNGAGATAVGQTATATGIGATALGQGSSATVQDATALGPVSTASAQGATAIGPVTTASAANAVAIGNNITNNVANSIALGSGAGALFYRAMASATVTQLTDINTNVTCDSTSGAITLAGTVTDTTSFSFTVNNAYCRGNSIVLVSALRISGTGFLTLSTGNISAGSFVLRGINRSGATAGGPPILSFLIVNSN